MYNLTVKGKRSRNKKLTGRWLAVGIWGVWPVHFFNSKLAGSKWQAWKTLFTTCNSNSEQISTYKHNHFTAILHAQSTSLFKLRAWQSFCTTSFHVVFGRPLGLEPSTSYSINFFTQSVSPFRSTCPYHRNLFCCSINIISSIPSLSLNSLLGTLSFTLTLHIYLTIIISARCCWRYREQILVTWVKRRVGSYRRQNKWSK